MFIVRPSFNDCHGSKILLFTPFIRQIGIPPGLLDVGMAHQNLNTFQMHPCIQKPRRKGMSIMPSSA